VTEKGPQNSAREKSSAKNEFICVALELSQRKEKLLFPGIDEEECASLLAVDIEFPGYSTPTEEIIIRMDNEGIKVVLGKDPESGNVFIMPFLSDNIADSLLPRHLKISEGLDSSLSRLIKIHKETIQVTKPPLG